MPLLSGEGVDILEIEVIGGAPATEHVLANVDFPSQCLIAAVIHEDYVTVPGADDRLSPGDTVVALVEDEATVKRLRLRGKRAELHPENPAFEPIVPDPENLILLGKVIEVRRYLERP